MALANIALLLARDHGLRVIVVDWDLEAPGLHRFFGFDDEEIEGGVIDLFDRYRRLLQESDEPLDLPSLAIDELLKEVDFSGSRSFFLLPAGDRRRSSAYAQLVHSFDWSDLYERWNGAQLVEYVRSQLKRLADIVLIDSRTGLTDIGGICTMHLPDVVVLVFGFNNQNIEGVARVARELCGDNRFLKLLGRRPELLLLPSRKETSEIEKLRKWELRAAEVLGPLLDRDWLDREFGTPLDYIRAHSVPYIPYFAYGEELAVSTSKGYEIEEALKPLAALLAGKPSAVEARGAKRPSFYSASKSLIICCDGSWVGEPSEASNVVKLAYRVAKRKEDLPQTLYYDQGRASAPDRLSGGAFGNSLDASIFDVYRFLATNYSPGDELYLFGVSRGALVAQLLAQIVTTFGVLERSALQRFETMLALYRSPTFDPEGRNVRDFTSRYSVVKTEDLTIRFIGLWDSVGSLGVPLRGLRSLTLRKFQLHDLEISSVVRHACQALAIDEERPPFEAALYRPRPGQRVEQVWFCGSHGDVGGLYETTLADLALNWMIERAQEAGLAFDQQALMSQPLNPDPLGVIHDSRTGFYRMVPPSYRPIGIATDPEDGQPRPDPSQSLHPSVLARWDSDPRYRPPNLLEYFNRTGDSRARAPGWPGLA